MYAVLFTFLILVLAGYTVSAEFARTLMTFVVTYLILDIVVGKRLSNWFKKTSAGMWIREKTIKLFGGPRV